MKNSNLSIKQIWKISKYSYSEAFTQSQLDMAGSGQTKILERMEHNTRFMKSQSNAMKFTMILYLGGLIFLPILTLNQINQASANVSQDWLIFVGSMSISLYFTLQTVYTILFGIFFASSLLSGETLKWFRTLPITKKNLQQISFFTFLRGIDVEVITITLALPVGVILATNNLLLTFVSLILSFANVMFSVSVLLILGKKMHNILEIRSANSTKATIIRVMTLLSYVFMTSIIGIVLQLSLQYMMNIFTTPLWLNEQTEIVNQILAVIPFPFANGYLLTSLYLNSPGIQNSALMMSLIGFLLFILVIRKTYRKSNVLLLELARPKSEIFKSNQATATLDDVSLSFMTPTKAFFKKDRQSATRDIQMMMSMIMPIILPLIGVATMGSMGLTGFEVLPGLVSVNSLYLLMGSVMVALGVVNAETSGATVLASLPVVVRDQAIAKIKWLLILVPTAGFIQLIFFIQNSYFIVLLGIVLMQIPLGIFSGIATIMLKSFLFGKMKYKYVLEEVRFKRKVLKWIVMVVFNIIIYTILLTPLTIYLRPTLPGLILFDLGKVYIPLIIVMGVTCFVIFNRMFPKALKL